MGESTKHKILIAAIPIAFLYLLFTTVWDRYLGLYDLYSDMQKKRESVMTLGEIKKKEAELGIREAAASRLIEKSVVNFKRDENGVIDFVESSARRLGVSLETLAPSMSQSANSLKNISLKITLSGAYHRAGRFVNALEEGPFPLKVTRFILTKRRSSLLECELDATAYVLDSGSIPQKD